MKFVINKLNSKTYSIMRLAVPGKLPMLQCQLSRPEGTTEWTLDILSGEGDKESDFSSIAIEDVEGMDFPNWTHVMAELEHYTPQV